MANTVRAPSWGIQKPPVGVRVNSGHPLAQSLHSVVHFWGPNIEFVYAGSPGSNTGGLTPGIIISSFGLPPASYSTTPRGPASYLGASGTTYLTIRGHQAPRWSRSIVVRPKLLTGFQQEPAFATMGESPSTFTYDRYVGFDATTFALQAMVNDGSAKFATGRTAVVGTLYHIIVTHDGVTLRLYVNGILDGSVAAGTSTVSYTTPELMFNLGRFNTRADADYVSSAEWTRCLTPAEVAGLFVEPYAYIQRPGPGILYYDLSPDLVNLVTGGHLTLHAT